MTPETDAVAGVTLRKDGGFAPHIHIRFYVDGPLKVANLAERVRSELTFNGSSSTAYYYITEWDGGRSLEPIRGMYLTSVPFDQLEVKERVVGVGQIDFVYRRDAKGYVLDGSPTLQVQGSEVTATNESSMVSKFRGFRVR